jgi:hypothetical protein
MRQCNSTKKKPTSAAAEKNAVSSKKPNVADTSTSKRTESGDEGGDAGEGGGDEGDGEDEGEDGEDGEGDEEGEMTRCCVCEKANSLCLDNNCDTCKKQVCYRAGHSDSCSRRMNVGTKEGGLVVRCLTCVQADAEKEKEDEAKDVKMKKSKTVNNTGEEAGAESKESVNSTESKVHNTGIRKV